jgi:N-acetylgalactosamine kinase
MGRTRQHKVCEPVLGRAMVVRLIDTLRLSNVGPLVVVVGYRAGSVIETIGTSHPGVVYAYQRDQLGTGHAARIGIEALCKAGYEGPVLITMGDKLFKPELLQKAFNRFGRSGADLLLVSSPKGSTDTAGRLVKLPGRGIMGIVEHRDIDRSLLLGDWLAMTSKGDTLSRSVLRRVGLKYIRSAPKLWRALGPLGSYAHGRGTVRAAELAQAIHEAGIKISVGSRRLGPDEVERYSRTVNQSIYIGGITVLQSALGRIGRDNAQDEYYLTDVVGLIAGSDESSDKSGQKRVVEYTIRREEALTYNTRQELLRVENRLRQQEHEGAGKVVNKKLAGCMLRPPQWLNILDSSSNRGRGLVERVYGVGSVFLKDRLGALRKVVRLFSREYGRTGKLFLVRAPGRINLMGRHIDHQGGFIHAVALDCEVLMAVAPRDDDVIRLVNTDPVAFPRREVVINDWRSSLMYRDWLSFVDSDIVRSHLLSTAGDWSNYVLSSAVYQQYRCGQRRLRGMDIAVGGNVPIAAGLSSSSSMVVGSMEAICAVNGLPVSGSDIVKFCGEAEWFVGSRGGSADHAAIKLGKSGRAVRIGFHPFKLSGYVPIPKDAAILVAFSGQHAVKSAGARDRFNERVACYRLGILLLKHKYPHLAGKLEYVCHLSSSRRVVTTAQARRMLTDLPERISRIQLRRRLGSSFSKRLDSIFGSHDDPGYYTIRDVVTYGIGEYERSRISADYLKKNDLVGFGELMLLSHDGDRVNGRFAQSGGDGFSDTVPLHKHVGAYACSTENIDEIVDIALSIPGVYGAQLAGAGLGGCAMILAQRSAVGRVKSTLTKNYYYPHALAPTIWEVRSVNGGGIICPERE